MDAALFMPSGRRAIGLFLCATLSLMTLGCDKSDQSARSADDHQKVLILAAASTQNVLERIADELRDSSGVDVTVSPGGSNALAQQIIAGVPGDLFLSAHPAWSDEVARHGYSAETVPLLCGQLVLIVPEGNPANVRRPDDLISPRVRWIALAGEQVPAGMYAQQALAARSLYKPLSESGRIVRGQNVRLTLAYVEQGEAEAGIVYASDAKLASGRVQAIFTFDPQDHEPILYPLVLLKHGSRRRAAREVFEFLRSPAAAAIFEQYGFWPASYAGGVPN